MTWLAIVGCFGIAALAFIALASQVKTKELLQLKEFFFLLAVFYSFFLTFIPLLIALNPTDPSDGLALFEAIVGVNTLALVYYVWIHGFSLVIRLFNKNDKNKEEK